MYNLLYSLISFIIAVFFVLIGVISILIPWSENVQGILVNFILNDAIAISLFGFAFIVIGLTIVIDILLNTRRSYYTVKSGSFSVSVDETVLQQYVTQYWKKSFPSQDIPSRLTLKNNQIHISVDLPYEARENQRPLLEQINSDLQREFAEYLGYEKQILLSASFQAAPKNK